MTEFVFLRVSWEGQREKLEHFRMPGTRWFDLVVKAEPGAPFGRKGAQMEAAWQQLRANSCAGMLVLDGDVAVDPLDYAAMGEAIGAEPRLVHVGAMRLWPQTTQKSSWVWGHWDEGHGLTQDWSATPDRWSFGFTYIPRRVLDQAAKDGWKRWQFPNVDKSMNAVAKRCGITAKVVPNCFPKHLHY